MVDSTTRQKKEQVCLTLVIRDKTAQDNMGDAFRDQGRNAWIARRAATVIDELTYGKGTRKCDNELAIEELARDIAGTRHDGGQPVQERAASAAATATR